MGQSQVRRLIRPGRIRLSPCTLKKIKKKENKTLRFLNMNQIFSFIRLKSINEIFLLNLKAKAIKKIQNNTIFMQTDNLNIGILGKQIMMILKKSNLLR